MFLSPVVLKDRSKRNVTKDVLWLGIYYGPLEVFHKAVAYFILIFTFAFCRLLNVDGFWSGRMHMDIIYPSMNRPRSGFLSTYKVCVKLEAHIFFVVFSFSFDVTLYLCSLGEAESGLERLHQCAEKEFQGYLNAEGPSKDFNEFRTKLAGLTRFSYSCFFKWTFSISFIRSKL